MSRTSVAFLAVLAALLASPAASAQACGVPITAPVSLTQDLVCPAGSDGMVIGADNLRIDLNGFDIRTQYVWGTRGIRSAGFKGVKLVGPGRIVDFSTAVDIRGGDFHEIRGIEVVGPSGTPLALRDTSASVIEDTRAVVISLDSSAGSRASANRIAGNVANVIFVNGCDTTDTEIADNVLRGSGIFVAVGLGAGSSRTRVVRNSITGASVHISGSSENLVEANSLSNTGASGYSGIVMGSGLSYCPSMSWSPAVANQVRSNGIYGGVAGVLVASGSFKNKIADNKIDGATQSGLQFNPGADDNDARGNWVNNSPAWAVDQGRGNLWP